MHRTSITRGAQAALGAGKEELGQEDCKRGVGFLVGAGEPCSVGAAAEASAQVVHKPTRASRSRRRRSFGGTSLRVLGVISFPAGRQTLRCILRDFPCHEAIPLGCMGSR